MTFTQRFRITIRDLFWLLLMVAISAAWWREVSQFQSDLARYSRIVQKGRMPTAHTELRRFLLAKYRRASDNEIRSAVAAFPLHQVSHNLHCVLLEMSRRKMIPELQQRYDALVAVNKKDLGDFERTLVLAALRRARGEPEPVQVKIESIQRTGVEVSINTSHDEQEKIYVIEGGRDLGGRRWFWHVRLIDENGKAIPLSNFDLCEPQLAQFKTDWQQHKLSHGEAITTKDLLEIRSYVTAPPPGKYQLQVQYALCRIFDESDPEGLIYWESEPIPVVVERIDSPIKYTRFALPIITMAIGAMFCIAHFARRALMPAADKQSSKWYTFREGIALATALGLVVTGLLGSQLLLIDPERVLNDRHADWWVIRPADEP